MKQTQLNTLPLAYSANWALSRFISLAGINKEMPSGSCLLYERAYMFGYGPGGLFSPGGSCRLLTCLDATLVANLPRSTDWELIPAWLGPWDKVPEIAPNDWQELQSACRALPASALLAQAHQLGMAVDTADQPPARSTAPCVRQRYNPGQRQAPATQTPARQTRRPLVVDLSSLWAGPLCGFLLQQAGCRVIKVEAAHRLDGARNGNAAFYTLLNQGKESVVLDFHSPAGIENLHRLINHADIVIEASRPRALRDLGVIAEQWVENRPGRVWLSITGYGRENAAADRIGFGDDCAAAAGLCQIMYEATGNYEIVGDAIADPLTGIHAATYALESYLAGGSELIALSLRDTVSYCLSQELARDRDKVLYSCRQWNQLGRQLNLLFPNGPRLPTASSAQPGQHNEQALKEFDLITGPLQQQHQPEILDRFV